MARVDVSVRNAGEDALFEAVTEGCEVGTVERDGGAEGGGEGDGFSSGAAAAFLASPEEDGSELHGGAHVEGAAALGGIEFVGADGIEIDFGGGRREAEFACGLDAIGVEEGAGFVSDGGEGGDVVDGAGFVVGVHDAGEDGFRAELAAEDVGIDGAVAVGLEIGDGDAFAFELGAGFEHGGMFDGGGEHVLAGARVIADGAEQGEVRGFGAAAGEDDVLGSAAQESSDLGAGLFKELAGALAILVDGGGVGPGVVDGAQKGFAHGGCDGGGRVMIEIIPGHAAGLNLRKTSLIL